MNKQYKPNTQYVCMCVCVCVQTVYSCSVCVFYPSVNRNLFSICSSVKSYSRLATRQCRPTSYNLRLIVLSETSNLNSLTICFGVMNLVATAKSVISSSRQGSVMRGRPICIHRQKGVCVMCM
jgi:hypothetical protein